MRAGTGTHRRRCWAAPLVPLAAPWGIAIAPASFGKFGGDLLVGNFSYAHSEIIAFDPKTHKFEGNIKINPGAGGTAGGLWTLTFGTATR